MQQFLLEQELWKRLGRHPEDFGAYPVRVWEAYQHIILILNREEEAQRARQEVSGR